MDTHDILIMAIPAAVALGGGALDSARRHRCIW
jgi:hypothetical protein